MKIIISLILSILAAYLTRGLIGSWLIENYAYGGSFIGPGSGQNFDGLVLSYVFFSSVFFSLIFQKIKTGFYAALPILVINVVLGAFDPQLWLSLILLAAGLGIAWLLLFLKRKAASR